MSERMPAIFVGHGNPMNVLRRNAYTDAWAALGASIGRPKAIVSVSAHWYIPETAVTAMPTPRTIHDFGGFPQDLYAVRYPAPGDPGLAKRIADLLAPLQVAQDQTWGLDHGTWSVLHHMFPEADIPVVQLSIDKTKPGPAHYDLGRCLAALRDEGVLLMGSGNIVHNLRTYAWKDASAPPYDWATRFETAVRDLLAGGDHGPLIDTASLGEDARLAIPTPEHYLPLLYVLGATTSGEVATFPVEGMDGGSISMLSARFG